MKNIESSSIVVQWDVVDDFLYTVYTIVWISERDDIIQVATVDEQTSYTIIGLTLDTVYTITVRADNICGYGPEFTTSISFSTDTTSTTSTISPTVTASTNPMTIISTVNPSSTTTTTGDSSSSTTYIITATIATLHATTVTTTVVESPVIPTAITYPTTATTTNIVNSPNPSTNPADKTTADETSEFSNTANMTSSHTAISYIPEGYDFL